MAKWHSAGRAAQQCVATNGHMTRLCGELQRVLRDAGIARKKHISGFHAGQTTGCLTQGFLVQSDWFPSLQLVVELVYFERGIRLQLAAYAETDDILRPVSDYMTVPDIQAQATVKLASLFVPWDRELSTQSLRDRRWDILDMIKQAQTQLAGVFPQLLEQLHETATP